MTSREMLPRGDEKSEKINKDDTQPCLTHRILKGSEAVSIERKSERKKIRRASKYK